MDTIYGNEMDTSYCLVDMGELRNQAEDRILLVSVLFRNGRSPDYRQHVSLRSQVACATKVSWMSAKGYSKSHASLSRKITDVKAISGATYPVYYRGKATIQRALGWVSRCWLDLACLQETGSQMETEMVFRPTTSSIACDDNTAYRAINTTWSSLASTSVSSLSSSGSAVSELSSYSTVYHTSVDDNESEAATESLAGSDPDSTDEHMSMGVILEPSSAVA